MNLQAWLAGKRRRDARCRGCLYAVLCPGFYRFEAVPPRRRRSRAIGAKASPPRTAR